MSTFIPKNLSPHFSPSAVVTELRRSVEMPQPQQLAGGEPSGHVTPAETASAAAVEAAAEKPQPPKVIIVDLNVDLNADPPVSEGEDCAVVSVPDFSARNPNDENNEVKNTSIIKDSDVIDGEDLDQQCQGVSTSREEKVSSLKAGLVHVARKMPKNAHAHYILGLMYQRLGQPQKAVLAFERASEVLQQDEEEIRRPDLLSLVLVHHAQCILQVSTGDFSDKELELGELEGILIKLKESLQTDARQAALWNTLGSILLKSGRLQSAISILSTLLGIVPDCLDSLANLGIAYLQSGNLELAEKCFQDLILKDQNHPAALTNYAAVLLCKYGSIIPGPGANASDQAYLRQVEAATVAKECLVTAVKAEPKVGPLWVNLANAYFVAGDLTNATRCLDQAAKLEPNQMSVRYAIAVHRIKDVERSLDATDQLSWASSEMSSILKEGDSAIVDLPIARAGLAMAHRAQHVVAAAFEAEQKDLSEAEEQALHTLKQAIEEDPDDPVQWHQLGIHYLSTMKFKESVKFLKAAVARQRECSYAWSNMGIALQLSDDASLAEEVYMRALSLASIEQAHVILSNLGNLYRQQKRFEHAKAVFAKSLEVCPGYAPAQNNLGLVFVAEGRWEEAKSCFQKALVSDPLLDAAESNLLKAVAIMVKEELE